MIGELRRPPGPPAWNWRDSTLVVIVAVIILGIFTSIADFSLYQVVTLFTALGLN